MKISSKLAAIKPSATLAITAQANALKAKGEKILSLAAGEPDFNPPACAVEAVRIALNEGRSRYTPAPGLPELRAAVAAHVQDFHGIECTAENVVLSTGGKQAVHNLIHALVEPGDEVLLLSPWWVSYPPLIELSGGIPVEVPKPDNGFLDIAAMEAKVTDKTKMIIVNSPSNPSGAVISEDELAQLEEFANKHDIIVLSDELYARLVYGGHKHLSPAARPGLKDRTVVVGGFSKCYAMTGWRLGFSIAPADVTKAIGAYQSHMTSNPNSLAQYAALAALDGAEQDLKVMWNAFDARRQKVHAAMNALPGVTCDEPLGAFYAFPNFSGLMKTKGIDTDLDLCSYLLNELKIAAVPGSAFGAPGHIRISYATSDEILDDAFNRMKEAFC